MARTRELVEKDLAKAQKEIVDYATAKGFNPKSDKTKMRHDPQWRRLNAEVDKYKNQVFFIDKRNAKAPVEA